MWLRCALYGLFFLSLPALALGQNVLNTFCQAPDPIQAAIREAGRVEKGEGSEPPDNDQVRLERQRRFKELAAKYPNDFWVARAYIDAMKRGVAAEDVIAVFKSRYDTNPKRPEAAYLYARALTGTDTPKAIGILSLTAASMPTFPLVLRGLGEYLFQSQLPRPCQTQ